MGQRHTIKNRVENKETHKAILVDQRITEAAIIKPEAANADYLTQNLAVNITQRKSKTERIGYMPILIFLCIGMILQLSGNSFCFSAGILICVSVCGLICISVFVSAIFSDRNSDSLSGLPEYSTTINDGYKEFKMENSNI